MSRHGGIGDAKILQRRVPSNSRYKSVPARVDTGSSITRYMKKIEDIQTNYRYKKDELFKRMKTTTLAQLVLQVANISAQEEASVSDLASARSAASSVTLNGDLAAENGSVRTPSPGNSTIRNGDLGDDDDPTTSPRSSLQSVIRGMGEVDIVDSLRPKDEPPAEIPFSEKPYLDCPYLILDVRDKDSYDACHIVGASHFPIAMLSRTMNNFTKEILDFAVKKNCPGRIIIVYDEDERISTVCATTMVERGFDNIFVLSGGLKVLGQNIPEGIVTGTYPATCRLPTRRGKGGKAPASYSGLPADPRKVRFSPEDLDKISYYLDQSLIPQDTGSRLSRLSHTRSQASSKADSTVSSVGGGTRRAWR